MTSNEIRSSFLKYFERNGHRVVPSSPLVPYDDPTLLFTNAGMNQFKDLFLGKETRDYRRATTSQKCMRVSGKHNDLDNVGPSFRHHTFFEMLGNFSFGDYFKKDAIRFAWELLTDDWKLSADRLYATAFAGGAGIPQDEEAFGFWRAFVPAERIVELGLADNFWAMGDTGPCGRCSEIHYFRGTHIECVEERAGRTCQGLACSCDRFIEIWNNVFMEFDRQPDGTLSPLPAPSIDTGMGLERITAVLQDKLSNYDTDLFGPLLDAIGSVAGLVYGVTVGLPKLGVESLDRLAPEERRNQINISMRVVADHIRATTFLIADGVIPSNEWRGYVLRKIMRRAMRHAKHLGIREPFLHKLVGVLVREMGDAYPGLRTNREMIEKTILVEEERFEAVLREGLPRLDVEIEKAVQASNRVLPGDVAFRLYDTFGLPYDFIEDTAATQHIRVDRAGYELAMEGQREKARAKSAFKGGDEPAWYVPDREDINGLKDRFEGYESTSVAGIPIVLMYDERPVLTSVLSEGQSGWLALPRTPFYIEAGGQVSDSGWIFWHAGH